MDQTTKEFESLSEAEKTEEMRKLLEFFQTKIGTDTEEKTGAREFADSAAKLLEISKAFGLKPPPSPRDIIRELAEFSGIYPLSNLAVEICCDQYSKMQRQQLEAGKTLEYAGKLAKLAYCAHMPKLSSRVEISDFIACVTHAMAVGILPGAEGTRLIYAAQVASSSLPSPKARKQQRKTPQNQVPVPVPTPAEATI